MNAKMEVPVIIFLIHGTFAKGAAWTRRGSLFRTLLTEDLKLCGHKDVHFDAPEWSGCNTHRARREAAVCLERRLRSSIRGHPDSRHFVVAHSHGGNIALRATRRSRNFSEQHVGVVTLATPFLKFSKVRSSFITRPLFGYGFAKSLMIIVDITVVGPIQLLFASVSGVFALVFHICSRQKYRRENALSSLMIVLLFGLLMLLSGFVIEHWGPTPGHWVAGLLSFVFGYSVGSSVTTALNLILLTVGVLCILVFAHSGGLEEISWKRLRKVIRQRRQIFRRFTYTQPETSIRDPVLSLSSGFDEALGFLTGVWILHRLTSWFVRTVITVLVAGSTALTAYAIYKWTTWMTEHGENNWLSAFLWETGNEVVLLLGFLVIAWTVWGVMKILDKLAGYSSIGLGMTNPDYNLLWRVNAQRHPGLGDNVEHKRYSFMEVIKDSTGLWFHSRLYSHPPAIKEIAEWMHRQNQ
jgi:hypothetical protein